ncbi:MAG: hypothetical protein N3D73_00360 [Candidatus Diapherotrites archaeon]|nr:hypothetical protein [Candidatus Diapherotrites archaeon]
MKELFFVTGNKHKFQEIKSILKNINLKQIDIKISEPDLKEEEVALHKAREAFKKIKKPLIVEDTGVYFSAYRNFPGNLAKRVYESIGFKGLIALLKSTKNKKGYFKTVICYKDAKREKIFLGKMRVKFLTKIVAKHKDRLPYEKIAYHEKLKKVICDLKKEEKNKISHRAKAARKLEKWLMKI